MPLPCEIKALNNTCIVTSSQKEGAHLGHPDGIDCLPPAPRGGHLPELSLDEADGPLRLLVDRLGRLLLVHVKLEDLVLGLHHPPQLVVLRQDERPTVPVKVAQQVASLDTALLTSLQGAQPSRCTE
eukprot:scaffold99115_cov47-Prasinocladus_malaysianus.AAC.1